MTREFYDTNGQPLDGTPTNAPHGDGYADFTHTPTPAERADYTARMAYDAAFAKAMPDMPIEIVHTSLESWILLMGVDLAEGKRLGRKVQDWRAMAEADAKAAIARGDYGEAAMNYAIMRAAK